MDVNFLFALIKRSEDEICVPLLIFVFITQRKYLVNVKVL